MNQSIFKYFPLLVIVILGSCQEDETEKNLGTENSESEINSSIELTTDKARYFPGDNVEISANKNLSGKVFIRYRHLGETIGEEPFDQNSWTWTLPSIDFTGYLVDVYEIVENQEVVYGSVAVDASSDWTVFPRYGFLSEFSSEITSEQMENRLGFLNRCHINAIQYYDWLNKHHSPLKMEGDLPANYWKDIAKREVAFNTVKTYIEKAKEMNIASMQYNLLYGAWDDYENDGVSSQWMLYSDQNHQFLNKHDLDDNWAMSDIFLVNPANAYWQDYIFNKTNLIYQFLDFDGWHIDQLGDRGTVYDFNGSEMDLTSGFRSFLNNLKERFPNKKMVLNAVDQYGQEEILQAPIDFAYTEVWSAKSFDALSEVIRNNFSLSGESKNSVLAAYMNYGLSNSTGYFNTPAVLLANAVIFAFGGAHLELGEHMLANEYFPNNNLLMRTDLKEAIVNYYDFLVAYQNLLRNGGEFYTPDIASLDGQQSIKNWPPKSGAIAAIGKLVNEKQIIHMINFNNASTLLWRDDSGAQQYPNQIQNLKVQILTDKAVDKVWFASPDSNFGVAQSLDFTMSGNQLTTTIPDMQYWGMLVIE